MFVKDGERDRGLDSIPMCQLEHTELLFEGYGGKRESYNVTPQIGGPFCMIHVDFLRQRYRLRI